MHCFVVVKVTTAEYRRHWGIHAVQDCGGLKPAGVQLRKKKEKEPLVGNLHHIAFLEAYRGDVSIRIPSFQGRRRGLSECFNQDLERTRAKLSFRSHDRPQLGTCISYHICAQSAAVVVRESQISTVGCEPPSLGAPCRSPDHPRPPIVNFHRLILLLFDSLTEP